MTLHLGEVNGGGQALVLIDSMRDNVWQDAAKLKVGEMIKIELSPWNHYEEKYGSWPRSDLNDMELLLNEPCWGKIVK